jgi:exopolyphosphatase/guanosine-5'-triphosphate,3'-diphosphate pyrophosphatase
VRVAVVDVGTNSTRLLIADVLDPAAGSRSALRELDKRSVVTRLGDKVDATGRLGEEAMARVRRTLDSYAAAIETLECERRVAVLTSAVRDAANGADFTALVRDAYGLDARTLPGEREAQLCFLGATATRDPGDPDGLLVIDIGGGSTELIVGSAGAMAFHVSTQNGVVRHTERHLHHDPSEPGELAALAADVRLSLDAEVPSAVRPGVRSAVAVAGTATSCAAIDLELEPYDPERVEGHVLSAARLGELRDRLAAMTLQERRRVPGLHPDRAPTIVAGTVILLEVLAAFGLAEVGVSERDILWGVALDEARAA